MIEVGAHVEFKPEHVCGYAFDPHELGYDPDAKCFLLKRVANATDPPAPLFLDDTDKWEAHAADETDAEHVDTANMLLWTSGYLSDRFPQTAAALREASDDGGCSRWTGEAYVRA